METFGISLPSWIDDIIGDAQEFAKNALSEALSFLFKLAFAKEDSVVSLFGIDLKLDRDASVEFDGTTVPSVNTLSNFIKSYDDPFLNILFEAMEDVMDTYEEEGGKSRSVEDILEGIPFAIISVVLLYFGINIITGAPVGSTYASYNYATGGLHREMTLMNKISNPQIAKILSYGITIFEFILLIIAINLKLNGGSNPALFLVGLLGIAMASFNMYCVVKSPSSPHEKLFLGIIQGAGWAWSAQFVKESRD